MRPKLGLLPSSGRQVRCSQPSCGRDLSGPCRTVTPPMSEAPGPLTCLFIPDGWSIDDRGRWRVQNRARGAFRHGLPDARRRTYGLSDPAVQSRGEAQGWLPWNLPLTIICDWCGTPLDADPAVLGVDPHHHEHRLVNVAQVGGEVARELCCNRGRAVGQRWQIAPPALALGLPSA
jgi:hypothetical protein